MNIAILSPMEVLPIRGGAQTRIFNLAKTMSDMGENVYLVHNSKSKDVTRLGNLNILSFPLAPLTLPGCSYVFHQLVFAKNFGNIRGKIDVVQCEFPSSFPWAYLAKRLHGNPPIVLDEHGVEIKFAREVYFDRPGLLVRARTLLTEGAAVNLSNHIFTCSTVDASQLSRIYKLPESKITEIPNAVGKEFFEDVRRHEFEKPTILFVGGFKHPPNYYGAKAVLDTILPYVTEREGDVQFVFIGEEPPSWLLGTDHVKVLGRVPDVRPFIKGADICISPIFQGSGTRLKILEYMALGKPVISTSKGAEGIEVTNNFDIVIEDDLERFSEHVLSLLRDKQKAELLGVNARRLIEQNYTWQRVCERAIDVYRKLFQTRRHSNLL